MGVEIVIEYGLFDTFGVKPVLAAGALHNLTIGILRSLALADVAAVLFEDQLDFFRGVTLYHACPYREFSTHAIITLPPIVI